MDELPERLTQLSEAGLRINDGLELDEVLQRVLESARALTRARYGVLTALNDAGGIEDFLASGLSPEEAQQLWQMPGGAELFEYVNVIREPWRVADFAAHVSARGLPEFVPPTPMGAFLTVPIMHRNDKVGGIHVAHGDSGQQFSAEDEETLVMFAAQAAQAIANARQYQEEQQARAALETLVETSPVGVVVIDARTGALVSFNREAARIADGLMDEGQSPEQLLDVLSCRRADGREVSLLEWPLVEMLSSGETVRAEEITLSVPDGRSVTALLNATPILSEGGDVETCVVTLQDLTPLAEQERLRADFLAMVSHELRTPLTSIRGAATAVLDAPVELDPAELRQFLRIIVAQADTMRDLIGDLLDVARIETGALSVTPEAVQVSALVDRARNTFISAGGHHNLDIDLAPNLPLVWADRSRIVQVIGNLLSNAARNSHVTSPIRVTVVPDGDHVAFSIVDSGRGITSEQLPGLFRRFARGGNEERSGDTGLGLAICKGIVETHGGRIHAESGGLGLGSRFTFTLPAAAAVETDDIVFTDTVAPASGIGSIPILVVDDDPQTLLYVRSALSRAGYQPIVAATPEEAIRLMAEYRPRLILLDMMLPGMDGFDLMRDLSGIVSAPVVFLSAYGSDQVIARAFEMGAADYVIKPFSPTELVARVGAVLRRASEGPNWNDPVEPYRHGGLIVDYSQRRVTLAGETVELTAKEYDLLRALSASGGRTLTHEQVLRQVWGPGKGDIRALRSVMLRLRHKIGETGTDPVFIFSAPRVGYRMPKADPPEPEADLVEPEAEADETEVDAPELEAELAASETP